MFAREIERTKGRSEELRQNKDSRFFETVVFECPVEASLNWKLNQDEQELISLGFGEAWRDSGADRLPGGRPAARADRQSSDQIPDEERSRG